MFIVTEHLKRCNKSTVLKVLFYKLVCRKGYYQFHSFIESFSSQQPKAFDCLGLFFPFHVVLERVPQSFIYCYLLLRKLFLHYQSHIFFYIVLKLLWYALTFILFKERIVGVSVLTTQNIVKQRVGVSTCIKNLKIIWTFQIIIFIISI